MTFAIHVVADAVWRVHHCGNADLALTNLLALKEASRDSVTINSTTLWYRNPFPNNDELKIVASDFLGIFIPLYCSSWAPAIELGKPHGIGLVAPRNERAFQ